MWRDIIAALGTVAVSLGGWEALKWLLTRKSNAKKAAAEADKARADAGGDYIAMYERVMSTQAGQVESLMKQVYEHTKTIIETNNTVIELKNEVADLKLEVANERKYHCEVRKCPDRQPPSDF